MRHIISAPHAYAYCSDQTVGRCDAGGSQPSSLATCWRYKCAQCGGCAQDKNQGVMLDINYWNREPQVVPRPDCGSATQLHDTHIVFDAYMPTATQLAESSADFCCHGVCLLSESGVTPCKSRVMGSVQLTNKTLKVGCTLLQSHDARFSSATMSQSGRSGPTGSFRVRLYKLSLCLMG